MQTRRTRLLAAVALLAAVGAGHFSGTVYATNWGSIARANYVWGTFSTPNAVSIAWDRIVPYKLNLCQSNWTMCEATRWSLVNNYNPTALESHETTGTSDVDGDCCTVG